LNELPITQPKRLRQFVLELIRDPMVFLLLACGLIYLVLGDQQEAIMLFGFIFLIIGITLSQDIVFISEGDRIPADGVLVAGSNVAVDESLLTGESIPVDLSQASSKESVFLLP